jgi:hypothetical protein
VRHARNRLLLAFAALAAATTGCRRKVPGPSEFVEYKSPSGDFECLVPKGWTAETAADGDAYRFVAWLGPEDREALWGVPRFVVAWHAVGKPFRKASGAPGKYESLDDYLRQMGETAWGPDPTYPEPRHAVLVGGRSAERLVVRVRKDEYMSLPDARPVSAGGGRMWRLDTAVFVPTHGGFYTIVFPCAEKVHGRYAPAFEKLLASFRFLKDNPVDNP